MWHKNRFTIVAIIIIAQRMHKQRTVHQNTEYSFCVWRHHHTCYVPNGRFQCTFVSPNREHTPRAHSLAHGSRGVGLISVGIEHPATNSKGKLRTYQSPFQRLCGCISQGLTRPILTVSKTCIIPNFDISQSPEYVVQIIFFSITTFEPVLCSHLFITCAADALSRMKQMAMLHWKHDSEMQRRGCCSLGFLRIIRDIW